MKRKLVRIMICLVLVSAVALFALMRNSSLKYEIMSTREKLKAQLMEEYHMRTKDLFESVEVQRPWYSLSPSDWTFVVKLSTEADVKYYKLVDRKFVESKP